MTEGELTLFLCGDVMTGRGVDQILPQPGDPRLFEGHARSALDYVTLAERRHGPLPRRVPFEYVWGDALDVLRRARPDARIVNLETSVTTSEHAEPKGINYRMHPANAPVLTAARIGCCTLANNHVLDWGEAGLLDTLAVLHDSGITVCGAGGDAAAAEAPAVLSTPKARMLIVAFATQDCGVPRTWAAAPGKPGVHVLSDLSDAAADRIVDGMEAMREPHDVVLASVHWGPNWGYEIPSAHRRFARALVDRAGVDIVHGHSSHHCKAIEVYRGRPILYGCGDFLSDYEGISGYEVYRNDLVLMYLPTVDLATRRLARLRMVPFQLRGFRLCAASAADRRWLRRVLDRECRRFGHRVAEAGGVLELKWSPDPGPPGTTGER